MKLIVTQADAPPRTYRFSQNEILVGDKAEADLLLRVHGSESCSLRIKERPEGGEVDLIEAVGCHVSVDGQVLLVGKAASVKSHIMVGDHKIVFLGPADKALPEKQRSPAISSAVAEVQQVAATQNLDSHATHSEEEAVSSSGAILKGPSYLYLFLEPIRPFLEDGEVSEVMINGPDQVYIERKGQITLTQARFINEPALQAAMKNVARSMGRLFDRDNPRLDARLPDGSRVHAVIPPLARHGTVVAIRKFKNDKLGVKDLIRYGSITEEGAVLLSAVVSLRKNIIVSGATSSGKTSVLNVLSAFIHADERILVLEDASELELRQPHTVYFETRQADEYGKGEVTIRELLMSCLRLRPDRIVIGEIRGGEALDLLQALNTGHGGSMSTIHANSPIDALSRMETCALFSGVEIPLVAIRSQVASAIEIIVQTARLSDKSRRITHISEVLPLHDGNYAVHDLLRFQVDGTDGDGRIIGRHVVSNAPPLFYEDARSQRVALPEIWLMSAGSSSPRST